jgi:hypothetical protein
MGLRARSGVAVAGAVVSLLFAGTAAAAPPVPTITEPAADGQLVHPEDVHMVVSAPENPADDSCTDWEILSADLSETVWQAPCVTGALAAHIHLGDGHFTHKELEFGSTYVIRARFHASDSSVGAWSYRSFDTYPASSPGGGIPWTPLEPGYVIDEVNGGLQLPIDIAFVPDPGSGPKDPLVYVTELYGSIEVITRDGTVSNYTTASSTSIRPASSRGPVPKESPAWWSTPPAATSSPA